MIFNSLSYWFSMSYEKHEKKVKEIFFYVRNKCELRFIKREHLWKLLIIFIIYQLEVGAKCLLCAIKTTEVNTHLTDL